MMLRPGRLSVKNVSKLGHSPAPPRYDRTEINLVAAEYKGRVRCHSRRWRPACRA
jgi:hypothetical protein